MEKRAGDFGVLHDTQDEVARLGDGVELLLQLPVRLLVGHAGWRCGGW